MDDLLNTLKNYKGRLHDWEVSGVRPASGVETHGDDLYEEVPDHLAECFSLVFIGFDNKPVPFGEFKTRESANDFANLLDAFSRVWVY
jgi:hypothetical protein